MAKFNQGDKVLINGNLVATILTYDEDVDRIAYVSTPAGGGSDTTYGHISQTRVEKLLTEATGESVEDEVPSEDAPAAAEDEITTSSGGRK